MTATTNNDERNKGASAPPVRPFLVLAALALALLAGAAAGNLAEEVRKPALDVAGAVGGLWLNALKMTVVPLVVAMLITAISRSAEAAKAGRLAGRTIAWIVAICTGSAIFGMLAIQLLTNVFPLPQEAASALSAGLASIDQGAAETAVPGFADFFGNVIPSNVIKAAANDDVLPLVVFAILFALALGKIAEGRRLTVVNLFEAIAETLIVIIGWVLWLAPIGVFALGFTVGASAGGAAFAGLGHYVLLLSIIGLLVTLAAYPLAAAGGRIGLARFARAMIGPQAVAISTRSSLASLPAMLTGARASGVREEVADVVLPLAVALLRATGPAMNVAVAFYIAHVLGIEPSIGQMLAATAVGAVMSYGSVSLPGEVSFISSIAPISLALGVPVAPLALFVAVEMIPDVFRTLGNVTMDVALSTVVDRPAED